MALMAVQVAGLESTCTGQFGDPMMQMHMGVGRMQHSTSATAGEPHRPPLLCLKD